MGGNANLTGKRFYNTENDRFVLNVKPTSPWMCELRYVRSGEMINWTGDCNAQEMY
jgi:hypothetical protein